MSSWMQAFVDSLHPQFREDLPNRSGTDPRAHNELLGEVEDSTEGWMSSPEPFVVAGIVAALKKHPLSSARWTRTAPFLRLLNKNWYREVNRHIVAVKEPTSETDTVVSQFPSEEVIGCLLKLPNLTSLELSGFISSEKWSPLIRNARRAPKLNRLTMTVDVLDSIQKEDLAGLVCKTVCITGYDDNLESHEQLQKLAAVRMERFMMSDVTIKKGWITDFLAVAPSVKQLDVSGLMFADDFDAMGAMEELKLDYIGDNYQSLAVLTSITALRIICRGDHASLEPLIPLSRLKVLTFDINWSFAFDRCFHAVIGRLSHLNVSITNGEHNRNEVLPQEFWDAAAGLKGLTMNYAAIDPVHLGRPDFSRLQTLSMLACKLKGHSIPWDRLTSLTSLALLNISKMNGDSILGTMDISPLKGVRDLWMFFVENEVLTEQLLQSVKQLTALERLSLSNSGRLGVNPFRSVFESWKQLPRLSDDSLASIEGFIHKNCRAASQSWWARLRARSS